MNVGIAFLTDPKKSRFFLIFDDIPSSHLTMDSFQSLQKRIRDAILLVAFVFRSLVRSSVLGTV